jgi:hypothetical protein
MRILQLRDDAPSVRPDAVLVLALDGWTDAGSGGSGAVAHLRDLVVPTPLGTFDGDALYNYRERRPALDIDRGTLGEVRWPSLDLEHLAPTGGPDLVVVSGNEPDLGWRTLADDLAELTQVLSIGRYVGLGSVPGPLPHTRPVQVVCTSNDTALLERLGRPHEQMVVPASCQVAIEASLASRGVATLGMWVRIPHYVAGPYPEASRALLERLTSHLGTPVDLVGLDRQIVENRARLDLAADASDEVREHVRQLERLYDAETLRTEGPLGLGGEASTPLAEVEVPTGEELAAEIERFLRGSS